MEPSVLKDEIKFEETTKDEQKVVIYKNYIHNYEFLAAIGLLVIGFIGNLVSIIGNYWICDGKSGMKYGLWDSCSLLDDPNTNLTITKCAIQTFDDVFLIYAETQLIDELNLAKSLLVISLCFYFIAFSMLIFTYFYARIKFEVKKNLIYLVRNLLVISLLMIFIAVLVQIIGFFLFIYVEKLSTGCFLLFIYFLLAIFVTNTINFFTIKYKSIYYDLLYLPSNANKE
jgi:hypothetical protein